MKKCRKCSSKKLEEINGIFVCAQCHEIYSKQSKLDALKKLHQIKEKNSVISAYNKAIEALQKERTAENLVRRKGN